MRNIFEKSLNKSLGIVFFVCLFHKCSSVPSFDRSFEDVSADDAQSNASGEKPNIYREKRRKNNEAARRSREKKRKHEIQLEEQLSKLKDENDRFIREHLPNCLLLFLQIAKF